MSWTVEFTIHAWWFAAYLIIGIVLWLPISWLAWRQIHKAKPFWRDTAGQIRQRPYLLATMTLGWPLALWEVIR